MKKILLTLGLAAFAFAANAQWVVGGNLGFSANGGNTHKESTAAGSPELDLHTTRATDLTLLPKVGYQFNEKMQIGASFGLQFNKDKNFTGSTTESNENYTSRDQSVITIAPYFRYNVTELGKFTLFCEASLGIGITPKSHRATYAPSAIDTTWRGNNRELGISLSIVPGLNYKFNEHLSADLYIDLLRLGYNYTKHTTENETTLGGTTITTTKVTKTHDFGFTANAAAGMGDGTGAIMHMNGAIRIGFNYHF